jgi:gamma-glutamylcyclotransferase (GGCT)/AIG2-like uncharacterized protein YtfP
MTLPLFVYGTLKRSDPKGPHRLLRGARYLSPGSIWGELYDLGAYPGVLREAAAKRRVFGELYELPDQDAPRTLRELDRYEGPEFTRERVFVRTRRGRRRAAWTYLLRNSPGARARLIPSGRYQVKRGAA